MPRRYQPNRGYDRGYADDYAERESTGRRKTPTWQTWAKYIAIGVFILIALLFILSATGNLKGSSKTNLNGDNQTIEEEPTQYEQMTTYIISQQQEGLQRDEIVKRLELAGFQAEEIEIAYQLSDPITQEILRLQKEGRTRQEIVEILLNQEITPEEIQTRFALIESTEDKGLNLGNNLIWIVLAIVVIFFVVRSTNNAEEKKRMPKVFTLDECEEYAREYLDNKQKTYNPSKQYRNRPDLRQYRFVYEETLYAEFNDHAPTGHKVGKRLYYLVCVGYDREVIDYQETYDDNKVSPFLYGAPKGFESSGSKEYMTLRGTSEQPIEERKPTTSSFDDDDDRGDYYRRSTPYRRRTTPYTRPGPVGFEER